MIKPLKTPKSPMTMKDVLNMINNIKYTSPTGGVAWVSTQRQRLKPKFAFRRGHSAGYADDLGIIADENQWVYGQRSGWYSEIDPQDYMPMHEWCEQNLKHGTWYTGIYYIFIEREEDVAWFTLRWS